MASMARQIQEHFLSKASQGLKLLLKTKENDNLSAKSPIDNELNTKNKEDRTL